MPSSKVFFPLILFSIATLFSLQSFAHFSKSCTKTIYEIADAVLEEELHSNRQIKPFVNISGYSSRPPEFAHVLNDNVQVVVISINQIETYGATSRKFLLGHVTVILSAEAVSNWSNWTNQTNQELKTVSPLKNPVVYDCRVTRTPIFTRIYEPYAKKPRPSKEEPSIQVDLSLENP